MNKELSVPLSFFSPLRGDSSPPEPLIRSAIVFSPSLCVCVLVICNPCLPPQGNWWRLQSSMRRTSQKRVAGTKDIEIKKHDSV